MGTLLLGALAGRPAAAIVFQTATAQAAGLGAGVSFLNGVSELIVTYSNGTLAGCSGSLLAGGSYILTAAHCVTGDSNSLSASSIYINFANVGLVLSSSTYVVDPVWNGNISNGGDLALISLATPVTSIAGYIVDTASNAVGAKVVLAGYGQSGTGTTGSVAGSFGTLYYGTNTYLGLYNSVPTVYGYSFSQTGADATMIAPGDSGGAALLNVNGTWEIVGVHDFTTCLTAGCTPGSTFGNYGGDTSVFADAAFIESVIAVPEPGTWHLLAGLVVGTGVAVRRGRAKSRPAAGTGTGTTALT